MIGARQVPSRSPTDDHSFEVSKRAPLQLVYLGDSSQNVGAVPSRYSFICSALYMLCPVGERVTG